MAPRENHHPERGPWPKPTTSLPGDHLCGRYRRADANTATKSTFSGKSVAAPCLNWRRGQLAAQFGAGLRVGDGGQQLAEGANRRPRRLVARRGPVAERLHRHAAADAAEDDGGGHGPSTAVTPGRPVGGSPAYPGRMSGASNAAAQRGSNTAGPLRTPFLDCGDLHHDRPRENHHLHALPVASCFLRVIGQGKGAGTLAPPQGSLADRQVG